MFVDCTDHFLDNEFSNAGSLLLRKDVFPDGFNLSSTKVRGLACWSPPFGARERGGETRRACI